jgi:hypothetical protein
MKKQEKNTKKTNPVSPIELHFRKAEKIDKLNAKIGHIDTKIALLINQRAKVFSELMEWPMRLTQSELISIISDVTTLLGDALAKHVELTETALTGSSVGVDLQKKKLAALQSKLAATKKVMAKLKDASKRKKELEQASRKRR